MGLIIGYSIKRIADLKNNCHYINKVLVSNADLTLKYSHNENP